MIHKLFTFPFHALVKLGEKIAEEVDRELYDLGSIQKHLLQLELQLEFEDISIEEYEQKEAELLRRYAIAKAREQAALYSFAEEED
ncbi:gas vesicle protein GvpG [Paenibacillus montanisoli]|uniref:Gas vesicle protein GvpG n=1 Tax=Paenibacillus montanisoli TaxID=2081970 RepID=A0A328U2S0_9BACL|nr:gas vesicle protein GvpG [Paenibacillus montanisoli]RAP75185.1 gas vesicle protein GvpG [Paenibacillus montanisoli]